MLLQGIPEQVGVVALAYAIAKLPFRWQEIIPKGAMLALIAYIIRSFGLPFGTHSLAILFTLFVFIILKRKEVSTAVLTALLSFGALSVFELISLSTLMKVFNVSQEVIFGNPVNWVLFTEPQVILLYITAFMVRRMRKVAYD